MKIVFGGGCFWCTEAVFQRVKGVVSVTPGYAGGYTEDPTYKEVSRGKTGHAEVVMVEYEDISLKELLDVFFLAHDATQKNRQDKDIGTQYRPIILYTEDSQEPVIRDYIASLDIPATTEVAKLKKFYHAEKYHQDYYNRNKNAPYCKLVIDPKLSALSQK